MLVRCSQRAIAQVRAQVGKGKVIYGLFRKDGASRSSACSATTTTSRWSTNASKE
jgi:hypothetical protein